MFWVMYVKECRDQFVSQDHTEEVHVSELRAIPLPFYVLNIAHEPQGRHPRVADATRAISLSIASCVVKQKA